MSDEIINTTGIRNLHYVLGWGNGKPASHSCNEWVKNFILFNLSVGDSCVVAEGKAGSSYAAWSKKNMTQLFRKWYIDDEIDSIQIEVIRKLRSSEVVAKTTSQILALTIDELLTNEDWQMPSDFDITFV